MEALKIHPIPPTQPETYDIFDFFLFSPFHLVDEWFIFGTCRSSSIRSFVTLPVAFAPHSHRTHTHTHTLQTRFWKWNVSNVRVEHAIRLPENTILARICVFYVMPKDLPVSFLSTYLPPFFGQIHQEKSGRTRREKKIMFKSIFDMGHKYNVIGRTHTYGYVCRKRNSPGYMHARIFVRLLNLVFFFSTRIFISAIFSLFLLSIFWYSMNWCCALSVCSNRILAIYNEKKNRERERGREKRLNLAKV